MAEIDDKELEQLRAEAAERKKLQDEMQALNQKYNQELQQVSNYAKNLLSQMEEKNKQPPADEPDDELFLEDPKKVKEYTRNTAKNIVKEELQPVVTQYAANHLETLLSLAENNPTMPNFKKYKGEIKALLSKDPQLIMLPDAVPAAYRLIVSSHLDEEIEERVKARLSQPPSEYEEEEEIEETPPSKGASGEPPVPTSQANKSSIPGKRKVRRLNNEEQFVTEVFGLSREEYEEFSDKESMDIY